MGWAKAMSDLPTREQWCTAHGEYECTDHLEANEVPTHCWGIGAHDEDADYASCEMVPLMTRREVYDSLNVEAAHKAWGCDGGSKGSECSDCKDGIDAVLAAAFGEDTT